MSDGEICEIPNTIRKSISSRLIEPYKVYCWETTSGASETLSDSILFAIAKHCSASVRKRLSDLDNTSAEDSTAFEELSTLCDRMMFDSENKSSSMIFIKRDTPSNETVQMKNDFQRSRNYLKFSYKMDISTAPRRFNPTAGPIGFYANCRQTDEFL